MVSPSGTKGLEARSVPGAEGNASSGRKRSDQELQTLPADMRARFTFIAFLIEEFGLDQVKEPHVKHLRGPLWEMRMKGRDGISRALYVAAVEQRVAVVRVFIKKTQRTPNREIRLALERAKAVLK